MSSRSSSLSSTLSKSSSKASSIAGIGSHDYRCEILQPNNIIVDESIMRDDRWSSLAFSLGIPARQSQRPSSETQKLAQRMRKRKVLSASQILENVKPFLDFVVAECPGISQQTRCSYHGDALPTHEALKNTIHRLPTPKPAFSLGYSRGTFSLRHDELQDGIIMGPNGEPCDLNHISQPAPDHFWPFFVVEISDKSMMAARQASAVTAATCNNALSILGGATTDGDAPVSTSSFDFDDKIVRTFSLSISGKEACLSSHAAQGSSPYVATTVETYRIDHETDVASLADRIHNIMIWAQYARLAEILATLDALDRRVHGGLSGSTPCDTTYEFDPSYLPKLKLQATRRPDRVRVALKAGLPRWLGK